MNKLAFASFVLLPIAAMICAAMYRNWWFIAGIVFAWLCIGITSFLDKNANRL